MPQIILGMPREMRHANQLSDDGGVADVQHAYVEYLCRAKGAQGALLVLLQGANRPQHVSHVVLRQVLARRALPAALLSLLILWLLAVVYLR